MTKLDPGERTYLLNAGVTRSFVTDWCDVVNTMAHAIWTFGTQIFWVSNRAAKQYGTVEQD